MLVPKQYAYLGYEGKQFILGQKTLTAADAESPEVLGRVRAWADKLFADWRKNAYGPTAHMVYQLDDEGRPMWHDLTAFVEDPCIDLYAVHFVAVTGLPGHWVTQVRNPFDKRTIRNQWRIVKDATHLLPCWEEVADESK